MDNLGITFHISGQWQPQSPSVEVVPDNNVSLSAKILKKTMNYQLGAAANFDDLVKFGDRRQIRRSQMFMKLAFELGCDVI